MYYFGARYQDPKLGIFISVDPLAMKYPGWSSYAYVLNNPVKFIDPTGMSAEDTDPPTWKAAAGEVYWDDSDNTVYQSNSDGSWTQSTELKEVSIKGYVKPSYFENYNKGYYDTYKHIEGENPYSPYTPDGIGITVTGSVDYNFTTYSSSYNLVLNQRNELAVFQTTTVGVSTSPGFSFNLGVSPDIYDTYGGANLFKSIEGYSKGGALMYDSFGISHSQSARINEKGQFVLDKGAGVMVNSFQFNLNPSVGASYGVSKTKRLF